MNTPTKAQRNKIDSAIDKIASLCTEDPTLSPSEAIAKVASAMQLTQDYLPIIVRAYNTGAAAIHRENSNSVAEKAASYPIADIDEVCSILLQEHPFNKKAAAEAPKDSFWKYNADYYWPNAWDYLKTEPDFSDWQRPQVKMARCTDYKDKLDRNATKTIDMIADEASRIKQAAILKRDEALDDVEYELCKYAGVDLNDARRYAQLAYGQEGVNVVNKIIKDNRLEKKARVKTFLDDNHPFAKAFERFVDNNEQVKKASIQERQILEACVDALGETVQPKDRYVEGMAEIDQLFKEAQLNKKKKSFFKQAYTPISADPHTGMTGLELMNHPGWNGLDRFERELMYSLADPAQEAELRKIRVQTILIDLMNTDPYLKDKDPEEVISAVNEILEVNPDLHNNKPMLRIALRQYMESGGMDIPTLNLVSEYGEKERDRKAKERSERESQGMQAGNELHRRLDERAMRNADQEYQAERDAIEDERFKQERKDRAKEQKQRMDALKKDREYAKERDKVLDERARLERQDRINQFADTMRHKRRELADENWRHYQDYNQKNTLATNEAAATKKREQDRRRYDLAHQKWLDWNAVQQGTMTNKAYQDYYKEDPAAQPVTQPDPTKFF